ncbi:hypothetical protein MTO96_001358 [Rhipicephalus appendiculatus]
MAPKTSRRSYTVKFKLTAVADAVENDNRAAGRHFSISEKLVRDWRMASEKIRAMKSTKKADRGKKARWPALEAGLRSWVLAQRAEGRGLSTVQVRLKAHTLAKEMGAVGFVGGPSWCSRFMRRNKLAIRACTTVCQKLPEDFEEKLRNFKAFFNNEVESHNVLHSHIINMDEVPLTFDILVGRTVTEKGEKTVTLRTTGHERSHFTVVRACCTDRTKLPPMVIFKRKTMPKESFPPGTVIETNKKRLDG